MTETDKTGLLWDVTAADLTMGSPTPGEGYPPTTLGEAESTMTVVSND